MLYKFKIYSALGTFRLGSSMLISSSVTVVWIIYQKVHAIFFDRYETALNMTIAVLILINAPAIICFIQYLYYSVGIELSVDYENRLMMIKRGSKNLNINFDEITKIEKVCSFAIERKRNPWAGTDPFYYFNVYTNDKNYILTCMIIGDLNDYFPGKVEVVSKLIPLIEY